MSSIKQEVVDFREKVKRSTQEDNSEAARQGFEDSIVQIFSVLVDIRDLLMK